MVKFEEELGQTKRPHRVSPSSRFAEAHYVGALEIRTSMKTVCSGEGEGGGEGAQWKSSSSEIFT